jgi:hypothetical protein
MWYRPGASCQIRRQVLSSPWLTDQLASLPGYDPSCCGEHVATPRPHTLDSRRYLRAAPISRLDCAYYWSLQPHLR